MARDQLLSLILARQHQKVADPWNRALFSARVVATVQMVALLYTPSRLSVKKEMIKKH